MYRMRRRVTITITILSALVVSAYPASQNDEAASSHAEPIQDGLYTPEDIVDTSRPTHNKKQKAAKDELAHDGYEKTNKKMSNPKSQPLSSASENQSVHLDDSPDEFIVLNPNHAVFMSTLDEQGNLRTYKISQNNPLLMQTLLNEQIALNRKEKEKNQTNAKSSKNSTPSEGGSDIVNENVTEEVSNTAEVIQPKEIPPEDEKIIVNMKRVPEPKYTFLVDGDSKVPSWENEDTSNDQMTNGTLLEQYVADNQKLTTEKNTNISEANQIIKNKKNKKDKIEQSPKSENVNTQLLNVPLIETQITQPLRTIAENPNAVETLNATKSAKKRKSRKRKNKINNVVASNDDFKASAEIDGKETPEQVQPQNETNYENNGQTKRQGRKRTVEAKTVSTNFPIEPIHGLFVRTDDSDKYIDENEDLNKKDYSKHGLWKRDAHKLEAEEDESRSEEHEVQDEVTSFSVEDVIEMEIPYLTSGDEILETIAHLSNEHDQEKSTENPTSIDSSYEDASKDDSKVIVIQYSNEDVTIEEPKFIQKVGISNSILGNIFPSVPKTKTEQHVDLSGSEEIEEHLKENVELSSESIQDQGKDVEQSVDLSSEDVRDHSADPSHEEVRAHSNEFSNAVDKLSEEIIGHRAKLERIFYPSSEESIDHSQSIEIIYLSKTFASDSVESNEKFEPFFHGIKDQNVGLIHSSNEEIGYNGSESMENINLSYKDFGDHNLESTHKIKPSEEKFRDHSEKLQRVDSVSEENSYHSAESIEKVDISSKNVEDHNEDLTKKDDTTSKLFENHGEELKQILDSSSGEIRSHSLESIEILNLSSKDFKDHNEELLQHKDDISKEETTIQNKSKEILETKEESLEDHSGETKSEELATNKTTEAITEENKHEDSKLIDVVIEDIDNALDKESLASRLLEISESSEEEMSRSLDKSSKQDDDEDSVKKQLDTSEQFVYIVTPQPRQDGVLRVPTIKMQTTTSMSSMEEEYSSEDETI